LPLERNGGPFVPLDGWNSNNREGAMEPSWTFPIPQALQQHRGSQSHKPKPADPPDAAQPADATTPAVDAPAGEAAR
jgi:hypothetical protein